MSRKLFARLAAALAFVFVLGAARAAEAQTASQPFSFRQGQSVYIVAFTRTLVNVGADAEGNGGVYRDYFDYQLDAEKEVREAFEGWRFFRVADKPREADFVFLVNFHGSAMEGLALPFDAYDRHFKEKFDLDSLRDAAFGRAIAGPLKLPTLGRLSDRLVKDFREKLTGSVPKSK